MIEFPAIPGVSVGIAIYLHSPSKEITTSIKFGGIKKYDEEVLKDAVVKSIEAVNTLLEVTDARPATAEEIKEHEDCDETETLLDTKLG